MIRLVLSSHRWIAVLLVVTVLAAGCATSPTGRSQLQLFPEKQMSQMGRQAYANMKEETPVSEDPAVNQYVQCVADSIIEVLPREARDTDWEITVFRSDAVNAFALPGGKMGVYTGLLRVAENPSQLAAVVGHEFAHVLADHSNERLSTSYATMAGLTVINVLAGAAGADEDRQWIMALLGVGAQVGVILPFSRAHETEADTIGLDLMAKAGFRPQESVTLWQNMAKASGDQPPEFLSTHPAHGSRIKNLRDRMPEAQRLYEQAQREGRTPACQAVTPEPIEEEKSKS